MTYAERIQGHLRLIAPDGATNTEIARRLGIASHQTAYMATRELVRKRRMRGEQHSYMRAGNIHPEIDEACFQHFPGCLLREKARVPRLKVRLCNGRNCCLQILLGVL